MGATIEERAALDFIRYANVWEDADVLCQALQPGVGKRFLSIASGGDNAFALAAQGAEVVAVDLNPAQLAVCELKMVAIAELEYDEVLRFLGVKPTGLRLATYQKLKGKLNSEARAFFDQNSPAIIHGVIHAGKFERYFKTFRTRVLPWVHGRDAVGRLLDTKSLEEQKVFYDKRWNGWRWRAMFRMFFSRLVMGRLGRDPEFFRYVEGSVADRILERTRYALTELPTASNPYLRYILTGNFQDALPPYLQPGALAALKNNLAAIRLEKGTVEQVAVSDGQGFDGFNLSDIFEYLDEDQCLRVYGELLGHARPGARFVYWNMLAPRVLPESLSDRVIAKPALAAELFAHDRAWFYSALQVDEVTG